MGCLGRVTCTQSHKTIPTSTSRNPPEYFYHCGTLNFYEAYYLYPVANTVRPSVDAGEMIMPA